MERTLLTIILTVTGLLMVCNILLLNYTVFRVLPKRIDDQIAAIEPVEATQESVTPTFPPGSEKVIDTCGQNCQKIVTSVFSQIDSKIATLAAKPAATPQPTKTSQATAAPSTSVKESFIPMGSGSTTKSDWEDIAGTDVFINTANFPNIKTVYFEASLRIPTKNGTVYARLYNVTDKHPVWNSDVSTEQDTSTFTASTLTLDPGNKQYRVQMKTTLQYQSLLDNARIKVITQ